MSATVEEAKEIVTEKTPVFTKEELEALRKALNKGVNGAGAYNSPPEGGRKESDDWKNDTVLLIKFLKDLRSLLSTLIGKRLPEHYRTRFSAILKNLQPNIDEAVLKLQAIAGPTDSLFKQLDRLGLLGDALLAKLDEFRDRIIEGPVKGVLEMGDTILDSLIAAIDILEPLKELKETIKNKIEFGADGDILQLNIYPYAPRP
jgi:hypothetical protein